MLEMRFQVGRRIANSEDTTSPIQGCIMFGGVAPHALAHVYHCIEQHAAVRMRWSFLNRKTHARAKAGTPSL